MKPVYFSIPIIQIRPGLLLAYDITDPRPPRRASTNDFYNLAQLGEAQRLGSDITKQKTYTGLITQGSAKRLRKCINILISLAEWKEVKHFDRDDIYKFKINFITLTLPSQQLNVTDDELKKKALAPFLRYWRTKCGGLSYVWRAERQKNGNLHFHIVTDKFIHYQQIRNSWNKYLNQFNFINAFENRNGHRDPNSTDVHSIKDISNLAGYLVKYMAKLDPDEQKIQGKVWDASLNLKKANYCDSIIDAQLSEELSELVASGNHKSFSSDRCTGMFLNLNDFERDLPTHLRKVYSDYLINLRQEEKLTI